MRLVLLYRPGSEHAGLAEDYARDFSMRHPGKSMEMLNLDTPAGAQAATLYSVVRYPALLALDGEGRLLELWQEEYLPLSNEVDFYVL